MILILAHLRPRPVITISVSLQELSESPSQQGLLADSTTIAPFLGNSITFLGILFQMSSSLHTQFCARGHIHTHSHTLHPVYTSAAFSFDLAWEPRTQPLAAEL